MPGLGKWKEKIAMPMFRVQRLALTKRNLENIVHTALLEPAVGWVSGVLLAGLTGVVDISVALNPFYSEL
jgi:hypothetical protein